MSWPDPEGGLRDYLRANAGVVALVVQRVFFGIPDNPVWPLITVSRVGGGDDLSEAPIDVALLQVDCWADGRNKAQAHAVASAVRDALAAIRGAVAVNGTTVLYGAVVESVLFAPDPADARPRYAITAQVTARAA